MIPFLLALFGAGCVVGFLAGAFGAGAEILLIPVLLILLKSAGISSLVTTQLAFGTCLLVAALTSLWSAVEYRREHHVMLAPSLIAGGGAVAGAVVGCLIAGSVEPATLRQIFALVSLFAAGRTLAQPRRPKDELQATAPPPQLFGTGMITGVVPSLAGTGGTMVSVPLFYSVLHFPLKKALGTSSVVAAAGAAAGTVGYAVMGRSSPFLPPLTAGYVLFLGALAASAGVVLCRRFGVAVSQKSVVGTLRKVLAAVLVLVALAMFLG